MYKVTIVSSLILAATFFISCSPISGNHPSLKNDITDNTSVSAKTNTYGAYLAGRVAHLRKDYDNAAAYYQQSYSQDQNPELIDKLYIILASQGKVDQSYPYAKKIIESGKDNSFAQMIVAIKQMHDQDYEASIKSLSKNTDPIYKSFINPVLNAWNYAGLNNKEKAFAEINKLDKEPSFVPIKVFHQAMLYDYFGDNRNADTAYSSILDNKDAEVSVRLLELITNFLVRTNQKDKAVAMMSATRNNQALDTLLSSLYDQVKSSDPKTLQPILSSASVGAAEALFTIASTMRYDQAIDVAHMYTALATYMNPDYSTAKILLADIYETREMFEDANRIYDEINDDNIAYYPAQLKKARNLIKQEDFKSAEILLKSLGESYDDLQIYMELGDLLRLNNRYDEAVYYYDKAISKTKSLSKLWVLHYAKGVALERDNRWKEAEASLMKAYNIKKHYLVLNHLGYTWIKNNQNIDKAFSMIVEAYNQAPFDPSINDSLGFALYNLGYYTMSLPYLERAAELYPSSAVISSHLGDAYWFAHRKNEAKFQWQHALKLQDESGELDIAHTKNKIKNGLKQEPELTYSKEIIEETIKKIKK